MKHIKSVYYKKLFMGTVDSMLLKYCTAVGGYIILGLPVFTARSLKYKVGDKNDTGAITKDFVKNFTFMMNFGKVILF